MFKKGFFLIIIVYLYRLGKAEPNFFFLGGGKPPGVELLSSSLSQRHKTSSPLGFFVSLPFTLFLYHYNFNFSFILNYVSAGN